MRGSEDFVRTIRRGSRSARPTLVVHCGGDGRSGHPRVGFIVARSVGSAVTRNLVRRRLRGVVVELRDSLPSGGDVVVRALPPAAAASYATLRDDYAAALSSAADRRSRGPRGSRPGAPGSRTISTDGDDR